MNYKIIANNDRKTITLLLTNVSFFHPDDLLEKTSDDRYWGNGVFEGDVQSVSKLCKEIAVALSSVNAEVMIKPKNIFESEDNPYSLLRYHKNKDKTIDKKHFEIALSSYSPTKDRQFFYKGLTAEHPVTSKEEVLEHEWGVELEINPYKDKNTGEPKMFVVCHRIVEGKKKETFYKKNDSIWEGFNFEVEETPYKKEEKKSDDFGGYNINDDDLPF